MRIVIMGECPERASERWAFASTWCVATREDETRGEYLTRCVRLARSITPPRSGEPVLLVDASMLLESVHVDALQLAWDHLGLPLSPAIPTGPSGDSMWRSAGRGNPRYLTECACLVFDPWALGGRPGGYLWEGLRASVNLEPDHELCLQLRGVVPVRVVIPRAIVGLRVTCPPAIYSAIPGLVDLVTTPRELFGLLER